MVGDLLENATYAGPDQIPAFKYALGEVLESLEPYFRDHVDVSIFRGNKQAWMDAGNASLMNLHNILETQLVIPTGQLVPQAPARAGAPEWTGESRWQLWAAEIILDNGFGEMWPLPDKELWLDSPWLSP